MNYRRRRNIRLLQLRAARVMMTIDMYMLFSIHTDHYHDNNTEGEEGSGLNVDAGIRWCEQSHPRRGMMQRGWRYLLYTSMLLVFSYFSYVFFLHRSNINDRGECQRGGDSPQVYGHDYTSNMSIGNSFFLMEFNAGRCIEPAAMPRPRNVSGMKSNEGRGTEPAALPRPRNESYQEECTGLKLQGRPMNFGLFSPAVPQAWAQLRVANDG